MNEADTCRKFVVPKLQAAGWDNEPHSIAEQSALFDELLRDRDSRQRTSQTGETNLWRRWERKYAEHGAAQLLAVRKHLPDVLKVPPVSDHGQIGDITNLFGGADKLRSAVNELQTLLYAA